MTNEVRIRVPERHRDALRELSRLSTTQVEELIAALEAVPAPFDASVAADALRDREVVEHPKEAIDALLALERTRASHKWDAGDVAVALASATELELERSEQDVLERLAHRAFQVPNLRLSAKASILISAHERMVHRSRVLTDIRPIFDDDSANEPVGSIIVHNLELSVWSGNRRDDFHFALDEDDLERLSRDIDWALEKQATLKRAMEDLGWSLHSSSGGSE